MKIEINGSRVYIDGTEFIRKDEVELGELITIEEIRPVYMALKRRLYLGFVMPEMKFNVGGRIRITKE